MGCLNKVVTSDIQHLLDGRDYKSRYFDGVQPDGLYSLDLFLDYYQNNFNSAGGNTDLSSTATFVRNTNCWAYDIDLTCCSPWNMHPTERLPGGVFLSSSNAFAGTLISPRHVIFCKHLRYYPPAGTEMRFVTKDNQTVTRTMTAIMECPNGDFAVGLLDSAVPETITFARILPDNWEEKFTVNVNRDDPSRPILTTPVFIISLNQDKSVFVKNWVQPASPRSYVYFFSNVPGYPVAAQRAARLYDSGNPIILVVDKKPILLSLFTSSSSGDSVFSHRHVINSTMTALGGGYTLTPFDLDVYTNAPGEIEGVGVVQPQSGLDYPFVAPSEDIRYLIADFHLSVDDPGYYSNAVDFKPPFSLKYLYGVGDYENTPGTFLTPTHAADIRICDSNNVIVFDSTVGTGLFSKKQWGDSYLMYTWKTSAGVCNLLAYSSCGALGFGDRTYNKYMTPQNGTLDARAIYVVPKRLLSVRVCDDNGCSPRFLGKLNFQNGYNTNLVAGETTVTNYTSDTRITLSANAGAGLGKYSNCGCDPNDPTPPAAVPIKKINGVAVTTGDFLLSAAECLYTRRDTVSVDDKVYPADDSGAAIGADCKPCCKCPEYVDLALQINQYSAQYANIGTRVNNVKQIHEQNIQKWLDERVCGLQTPLRLLLVPQRCPYMDIVLMVCNPCNDCLYSKELKLELEPAIPATAEVVSGYTAMFAATINGRPWPVAQETQGTKTILRVQFPVIKASDSAYIRFRVKFSEKAEYAVTGTLTGTLLDNTPIMSGCDTDADQASRIAATAVNTQALYCDAAGETNLP